MTPSNRDTQLTAVRRSLAAENSEDAGEDVRLLDEYLEDENLTELSENLKRIQVRVTGMTCAACSNSVEGALSALGGVVKASVALLQNRADVIFDPNLVKVNHWCFYYFYFWFYFLIVL